MTARTLPGLGLSGDWDLGEKNWKDANDLNLVKLSVMVGGCALSLLSALPGSPSEGDIHLLDASAGADANKVAVYDEGAWVLFAVPVGSLMFDIAAGYHRAFDGSAWIQFTA